MARVTINEEILGDIADSIRDKTETTGSIAPADMAELIMGIASGSSVDSGEITPVNTDNTIDIETELTEVNFIIIVRKTETDFANNDIVLMCITNEGGYAKSDTYYYGVAIRSNWGNVASAYVASVPYELSEGIVTIDTTNFSNISKFTKGVTYKYYMF